jgi:hypothetical protein
MLPTNRPTKKESVSSGPTILTFDGARMLYEGRSFQSSQPVSLLNSEL